ncbi:MULTISPECIES: ATP-binding protein [unclassified Aureimonas]|uniref:ATP-binding protein n=1 Tax=unclassified Aureimonas TaxID=2615206 RepID=UPI0006F4CBA8|nr:MULTISPECIES: ATP-binding protein [unclassified Aureimonas]KQT52759.1 hypothetical protein ASG62_12560 [Aureimonas sp. Leaf427]KQT80219.1 hypothetical protein ASG54_06410 [Aureimonas sp. Leaf460]
MRIVKKINLTLVAAMVAAAGVNAIVVQTTIMPLFYKLEEAASERNEGRALEAIEAAEERIADAAAFYAAAIAGGAGQGSQAAGPMKEAPGPEAMKALGLDYAAVLGADGRITVSASLDGTGSVIPGETSLPLATRSLAAVLKGDPGKAGAGSGLVLVDQGPVAIGYARFGGPAGTRGAILFGRKIDVADLNAMTKVKFRLDPAEPGAEARPAFLREPTFIETRRTLTSLDGRPVAELVTTTTRRNVAAGQTAIWWASGLMFVSMLAILVCLSLAIRRIAVQRIERMRAHLGQVAASGDLDPMPQDGAADELSETIASFNRMAEQLADLRSELRRSDYRHGAADQAAGLLHNIRNAVSPIAAMAWDLERRESAGWRTNMARVLDELGRDGVDAARTAKLQGLLVLSAREALKASGARQGDLQLMGERLQHVEEILREEDRLAQTDRVPEPVDLADALTRTVRRLGDRPDLTAIATVHPGPAALGHRVVIDQILDNLVVNAVQAIEAAGPRAGRIELTTGPAEIDGRPAIRIDVTDNGDGILEADIEAIFRKGFSTRRDRTGGLGLHWCANAARAMGGGLRAESRGRGEGATLCLTLPVADLEERVAA